VFCGNGHQVVSSQLLFRPPFWRVNLSCTAGGRSVCSLIVLARRSAWACACVCAFFLLFQR
jgi:hypothetical protein